MNDRLEHGIREGFVPKALLVLDVVLWLFALPMMLRMHSVPALLTRFAARAIQKRKRLVELQDAVAIVTRTCDLSLFVQVFFPGFVSVDHSRCTGL